MIAADLARERLVQPFATEVHAGRYWLTRLRSRPVTAAMREFRHWLLAQV
jgi:LysR family transcriptional regulator of beta-lactamase